MSHYVCDLRYAFMHTLQTLPCSLPPPPPIFILFLCALLKELIFLPSAIIIVVHRYMYDYLLVSCLKPRVCASGIQSFGAELPLAAI